MSYSCNIVTCCSRPLQDKCINPSINIKYIIYSKDLTENEADRYISLSLEKYCSVGATINDKTTINHSFEIIR